MYALDDIIWIQTGDFQSVDILPVTAGCGLNIQRVVEAYHSNRIAVIAVSFHTQRMDAAYHINSIAEVFHTQRVVEAYHSKRIAVACETDGCVLSH